MDRSTTPPVAATSASGSGPLRGRVSTRLLLLLIIGDILGAGIYVLIGELASLVGGLAWAAFFGAFVVALTSAASYAELVTRYPGAAGSALYVRHAFGSPTVTASVGLAVLLASVATSATTARAFAGDYLTAFVDLPVRPVALAVVVVLAAVAALGIEASAKANATLTLVEISGLVMIIVIGAVALFGGDGDPSRLTESEGLTPRPLFGAVALAFFAFLGFEDAVHLSEEVENPRRTFPPVLIGAVVVTGIVYLLVAVSSVVVVEPDVLAASDGPLLEVARLGPITIPPRLFAAIALGAVTNTSLFALVAAARLLYGMARQGDLPAVLGRVSRRGSPAVAAAVAGSLAAVLAVTGAVGDLARTAVTALLAVLLMVNLSAIRTRSAPGGWRPSWWVAVVGAGASALLLAFQLYTATATDHARLAVLVVFGIAARFARPAR